MTTRPSFCPIPLRKTLGSRFVFLSDEFYLGAKRLVPTRKQYEGFPQLEDGVGLVRLFLDDLDQLKRRLPPAVSGSPRRFTMITGESAGPLVQQLADTMNRVRGLEVNVCVIHNRFFEGNITVAGLLVGKDIVDALADFPTAETVIIPTVMMRDGENVFLDEMSLDDVARAANRRFVPVERTPSAAAAAMLNQPDLLSIK